MTHVPRQFSLFAFLRVKVEFQCNQFSLYSISIHLFVVYALYISSNNVKTDSIHRQRTGCLHSNGIAYIFFVATIYGYI